MFEFLFKYPSSLFAKGNFVLLGGWPVWLLIAAVAAAAVAVGWPLWQRRERVAPSVRGPKSLIVWLLQLALIGLILLLLWQPALSVAELKPQQNIVAVVIDDSHSMSTREADGTRRDEALKTLNGGLLDSLKKKFQVRLYRLGDHVERMEKPDSLNASQPATHLAAGLKEVLADSATLPIGALVLLSDGADNSGGIDLETISEIRRQRIPVHTIGFGREQFERDVEMEDVQIPAKALANSRLQAQVSFRQRGYSGRRLHLTLKEGAKCWGRPMWWQRETVCGRPSRCCLRRVRRA